MSGFQGVFLKCLNMYCNHTKRSAKLKDIPKDLWPNLGLMAKRRKTWMSIQNQF